MLFLEVIFQKDDNLKLIFIKLYDSQTVFMIKTLGVMIKTDMFFWGYYDKLKIISNLCQN